MSAFRDIRVIPVVAVAIFGLAVLNVAGLVIDGGYVFDVQPASAGQSWAQQNLNFPGAASHTSDITGSVGTKKGDAGKDDAAKDEPNDEESKPAVGTPGTAKAGAFTIPKPGQSVSPSERAILKRLQSRR